MKRVHVGNLIDMRLKQLGMPKAEFARRINKSPQNIQDLVKRSSVDTDLLLNISEVLGYNFFKAFIPDTDVIGELSAKRFYTDENNE